MNKVEYVRTKRFNLLGVELFKTTETYIEGSEENADVKPYIINITSDYYKDEFNVDK